MCSTLDDVHYCSVVDIQYSGRIPLSTVQDVQ